MSEVKLQRLEIETRFGHAGAVMVNDDSGDYYRADDVDEAITTLQRERDELKNKNRSLHEAIDEFICQEQGYKDEIDELKGVIEEVKEQRDDLQAIVDKLPRNKSGTLPSLDRALKKWVVICGEICCGFTCWSCGQWKIEIRKGWDSYRYVAFECSYDTREAAEAAKGGEG